MLRHNRRSADIGLSAITVEGGLIAPAQIALIAATTPDLKAAQDYGCPKGTNLRDEITRYFRITQAHWQSYARIEQPNSVQTSLLVKSLLEDGFGFGALTAPHRHHLDDHDYRITFEGRGGRVPIVVAAPLADADAFTKSLSELGDNDCGTIARRSPVVLLQDWLNANDTTLWGLCFAGDRLRLMRDNASITRQAYIEADLGAIFRDEMFADFTALWLMIHATRFGSESAADKDCPLERWRVAGQQAGTAARNRLRVNVEDALMALGQGFLDANPVFRARLDANTLPMNIWFEQLLRIVYRMIFMAVAEDRDLLHGRNVSPQARALYREAYGFDYLRERSGRRAAHDHHHDAWEGLKITFAAMEHGERQLTLPALGGLFSSDLTPELNDLKLPNKALLAAVFRLSFLIDNGQRVRINWRDMATEELGSVYESLLELVPIREQQGRIFAFASGAETKGNSRKVSGSYYTPDSLVQALLDTTLNPVLDKAEAEGGADAILALNVIDPACGSGHFLLGAARRMATRVAQLRDPDAPDYNAAMRDVVRNCIHGVDRNPMAVELTKVALWIETVEPDKPLGFLDANIRCGDSLLGVFDLKMLEKGIPDAAYKPLTGDDKEAAKLAGKVNKQQRESKNHDLFATADAADLAAAAKKLHDMAEDSPAQLKAKVNAFSSLRQGKNWWAKKAACDLYIAAFLSAKHFRKSDMATSKALDFVPTTLDVRNALAGTQSNQQLTARAIDLAGLASAFHWPLEFADVMAAGGFDIVIGNPPWERAKLQEVEFFSSRHTGIASASTAAIRKQAIAALFDSPEFSLDRSLLQEFLQQKRSAEASIAFFRFSNRFLRTAVGDLNTYALFSELAFNLINEKGLSGLVVPSGIATESATSEFFGYLSAGALVRTFYDFENRAGFFHGLHTKHKFAIFTLSKRPGREMKLCFFANSTQDITDERKELVLTPSTISLFNPNTSTLPIIRSVEDARLLSKIYHAGTVLIDKKGGANPWAAQFLGMYHMTLDSDQFVTQPQPGYVNLYEAKMFWHYDHRWMEGNNTREPEVAPLEEKINSRYYVPIQGAKLKYGERGWNHNWIMAFRNISDSRNERTFVTSILPFCGLGNSATALLVGEQHFNRSCCLLANANSIVFDYAVRQKIPAMNINLYMVEQFPFIPPQNFSEKEVRYITDKVIKLTVTDASLRDFSLDFGGDGSTSILSDEQRYLVRAEIDAFFALKYGLSKVDLSFILSPADVMGADYPSETFRVLMQNELRLCGEYRTRRLVLEAYDRLRATV